MRVSPDCSQVLCILIQKAAKRAREATRLDFTSFTFRRILAGVYSQELWSVANALLNERHYTEDEHVVTTEEVERTALKSICLRMISSRLTRNSRKRYLNFSDDQSVKEILALLLRVTGQVFLQFAP